MKAGRSSSTPEDAFGVDVPVDELSVRPSSRSSASRSASYLGIRVASVANAPVDQLARLAAKFVLRLLTVRVRDTFLAARFSLLGHPTHRVRGRLLPALRRQFSLPRRAQRGLVGLPPPLEPSRGAL